MRNTPLVALAAVGLVACGSGTGQLQLNASAASQTGALTQASDYTSIVLEVLRIEGRLKAEDSDEDGWQTLRSTPVELDLIALDGGDVRELADVEVPVGTITELRLILAEDVVGRAILASDGSEVPLRVPSGTSSGLKFKGSIEITEEETAEATMEFDVQRSISDSNDDSLRISPVIRILD